MQGCMHSYTRRRFRDRPPHTPAFDPKPPKMISVAPQKRVWLYAPLSPHPSSPLPPLPRLKIPHIGLPLFHVSSHTIPPPNVRKRTRRKKDSATAILDPSKKRSPNRMVVDEATSDDNSVVALSTAKVTYKCIPRAGSVNSCFCGGRVCKLLVESLRCCVPQWTRELFYSSSGGGGGRSTACSGTRVSRMALCFEAGQRQPALTCLEPERRKSQRKHPKSSAYCGCVAVEWDLLSCGQKVVQAACFAHLCLNNRPQELCCVGLSTVTCLLQQLKKNSSNARDFPAGLGSIQRAFVVLRCFRAVFFWPLRLEMPL